MISSFLEATGGWGPLLSILGGLLMLAPALGKAWNFSLACKYVLKCWLTRTATNSIVTDFYVKTGKPGPGDPPAAKESGEAVLKESVKSNIAYRTGAVIFLIGSILILAP